MPGLCLLRISKCLVCISQILIECANDWLLLLLLLLLLSQHPLPQAACIIQTLDDAEALLFLDKNFNELFNRMPADEVAVVCKRELSRLSQVRCFCRGVWGGGRVLWVGERVQQVAQACGCCSALW